MGVFSYSLSFGLLVKAEKVRYMTYTLMTPGCSRPDVGCTAGTQRWIRDLIITDYTDRDSWAGANVIIIANTLTFYHSKQLSTNKCKCLYFHSFYTVKWGNVLVSACPHVSVCMERWPTRRRWGTGCRWWPGRPCYINRPRGRCRTRPWRPKLLRPHWTASESQRPKLRTTDGCMSLLNSCRRKERERESRRQKGKNTTWTQIK